jgi:hypothetical protein
MTTNGRIFQTGATRSGLMVAALMVSLLGGTAAARADEDCAWYALTSAKQMQTNTSKSCGHKGDGWSTDQEVHLAYCASVSPEEWRKAVEERKKQLQSCAG